MSRKTPTPLVLALLLAALVPGLAYAVSHVVQDPWWLIWLRDYGLFLAINGISVWASWSSRQYFVSRGELDGKMEKINDRISDLDNRLLQLETATASMPGRVEKMCERLGNLVGDNKEIKARIDGLEGLMKRIDYQLSMMLQGHMREDRE